MNENINILGVFHDGSIVEINGDIPSLQLRIEIEYLRNMFPEDGISFIASVSGCSFIQFHNWENATKTSLLAEIQSEEPEILSVEQEGNMALITCVTGELKISYEDIEFKLDTGSPISYSELEEACDKYWDDWERNRTS